MKRWNLEAFNDVTRGSQKDLWDYRLALSYENEELLRFLCHILIDRIPVQGIPELLESLREIYNFYSSSSHTTSKINSESLTLVEQELASQVTEIAMQEGQSAADFVADSVRRHVAAYHQKRIQVETAAWYALPAAERAVYAGKFVAVREGQVIDSDEDQVTLFQRLRQQYGKEPIPIIPGGAEPMPTYRIPSVRHA